MNWVNFFEDKYNLPRCVVACEARDEFADKRNLAKQARKLKAVERIDNPRLEYAGNLFLCIDNIDACKGEGSAGSEGEPRTKIEEQVSEKFASYRSKIGDEAADKLLKDATDIADNGFSEYLAKKLLGESIGKLVDKGVPVLGWINLGIKILDFLKGAPEVAKVARYTWYAQQAAAMYMTYRSNADELKAGKVSAETAGSFANGFGTSDDTQGMGLSPAYNQLFDSTTTQAAFFSGSAHAEGDTTTEGYRCGEKGDGDVLGPGKLICPEETFAASGFIQAADGVAGFAHTVYDQPYNITSIQITLFKNTVGRILDLIGTISDKLTGPLIDLAMGLVPQAIKDKTQEAIVAIQNWAINLFIGNACSSSSSPARTTQCVIAGGLSTNMEYANNGLGGQDLTDQQAAELDKQHQDRERYAFTQKPLLKRLFDTDDYHSLTAQIAIALPGNKTDATKMFAGMALNPLSSGQMLANASLAQPVNAATRSQALCKTTKEFGLRCIGVPADSPALTADPDTITDEKCTERNKQWYENYQTDEGTGYRYRTEVNECKLEKETVGAFGGLVTSDVLDADQSNLGGDPSSGGTTINGLECPANIGAADSSGYYLLPPAPEYTKASPDSQQHGTKDLICVINTVAKAWIKKYPNSKLSVSDLNAPGHKSHRKGIDVDLDAQGDPIAGDFVNNPSKYSAEASIELGKMFADTGIVTIIYFNDKGVQDAVNSYAKSKKLNFQMKYFPGHDNHFHVRIHEGG